MDVRKYNMRDMNFAERGEVARSFPSDDPEEKDVVGSLARMPFSPDDLNTLSKEMPEYLAKTGLNLVMIDDVAGGISRQLAMGPEGAGVLNRKDRGSSVELDYDRLRGILERWNYGLKTEGIELDSTEDAKELIAEVQGVTGTARDS